jgi:hypothetical protein
VRAASRWIATPVLWVGAYGSVSESMRCSSLYGLLMFTSRRASARLRLASDKSDISRFVSDPRKPHRGDMSLLWDEATALQAMP